MKVFALSNISAPTSSDATTWVWWSSMIAVAILNICFFVYTLKRNSGMAENPSMARYQTALKCLAVPFVFECAYRSVFPCLYNNRQTFFDSPLNIVLIDRSLAAVGEVCWVSQIALAFGAVTTGLTATSSTTSASKPFTPTAAVVIKVFAGLMVALAVAGECNSYMGTFTTNCLYEVVEASCWTSLFAIGGVLGGVTFNALRKAALPSTADYAAKNFAGVMGLQGLIYVPYMLVSNIPMYYARWLSDQRHHKHYFSVLAGAEDALHREVPTRAWNAWSSDWFWMSFYFSFAVWSSILLVNAPQIYNRPASPKTLEDEEL